MSDPVNSPAAGPQPKVDRIPIENHPIPRWWTAVFVIAAAYSFLYVLYAHSGAPGRSLAEQYSEAMAANMRLQFADIGDLQPDEATLVRMMYDRGWMKVGESVYRAKCASCHGLDGGGLVGPNLTDEHYKNVRRIEDVYTVVRRGAAGGAMPGWEGQLHPNELVLVSSYVASLRGTEPASPRGPEGVTIPPWPEPVETPEPPDEAATDASAQ